MKNYVNPLRNYHHRLDWMLKGNGSFSAKDFIKGWSEDVKSGWYSGPGMNHFQELFIIASETLKENDL